MFYQEKFLCIMFLIIWRKKNITISLRVHSFVTLYFEKESFGLLSIILKAADLHILYKMSAVKDPLTVKKKIKKNYRGLRRR